MALEDRWSLTGALWSAARLTTRPADIEAVRIDLDAIFEGSIMGYEHTQHGHFHRVFLLVASMMLIGAWLGREERGLVVLLSATAAIFLLCSLMFGHLTIRDEGERLALRYGPLPVIRKRFRYADITSVEPDRIKLIDGWGVHYILGRGWTYNLWGFGCVKLAFGRKIVRVGSGDVENLVEFLRGKLLRGVSNEPSSG